MRAPKLPSFPSFVDSSQGVRGSGCLGSGDIELDPEEGISLMAAMEGKLMQSQQQQQQQQAVVCGSKMVRVLMLLLAVGLSVYTVAPAVYWHVVAEDGDVLSQWVLQCPPCSSAFDCSKVSTSPAFLADAASKLLALAQKLNSTPVDCHGSNKCMKESMGQTQEQLQKEGLKLQKEAKSAQQRANSSGYFDASRKTVYRGASSSEKFTSAQQARAEEELALETARANLWEKRARDLGWKSKAAGYQKYKKYYQMLDGGA